MGFFSDAIPLQYTPRKLRERVVARAFGNSPVLEPEVDGYIAFLPDHLIGRIAIDEPSGIQSPIIEKRKLSMDIFLEPSALVCIGDFRMREVDMKTRARRILPFGLHVVATRSDSAAHAIQKDRQGFWRNPIVGIFRVVIVAIHHVHVGCDESFLPTVIVPESRAHMIAIDGYFEVVC